MVDLGLSLNVLSYLPAQRPVQPLHYPFPPILVTRGTVKEPEGPAYGGSRATERMGYQGNGRDEVRNGWNREETVARLVPSSLTLVGSCLPSFGCVSLTHPSPHLRLVSASGDERREEAERREQEVRDDEGRLLGPSISACGHRYHLSTLVSSSVPLLLTSPKAPRDEGTR